MGVYKKYTKDYFKYLNPFNSPYINSSIASLFNIFNENEKFSINEENVIYATDKTNSNKKFYYTHLIKINKTE